MKPRRVAQLPESDRNWAFHCDVSPDGKHYVYSLEGKDGKSFVLDDKKSPKFEVLLGPWFDDNTGTLVYKEGKPRKFRWHVGDDVHGVFDQSDNPVFSPDGKRHCYAAKKGKDWKLVVDGKPEKESYERVGGDPVWSPDGTKIAFTAKANGKEFVVVNGERLPPCVSPTNLAFSSDGSKLAYLVEAPPMTQYQVVCGSFASDKLDLGTKPQFTPKGDLVFTYSHTVKRKSGLQIGKRRIDTEREVNTAFFLPDGSLAGHIETDGRKSFLIQPGQAAQEFPNFHEAYFRAPNRFAIVADKMTQQEAMTNLARRMVMCANGKQSEEYDLIKHPRFSADGKSILFGAVRERDLWWVEMDAI
jgi:dipeptidyl aminopeptidase/acylaminoacyl peptidase